MVVAFVKPWKNLLLDNKFLAAFQDVFTGLDCKFAPGIADVEAWERPTLQLEKRPASTRLRQPAPVAEPVDARDSKSRSERSASSSLARGTIRPAGTPRLRFRQRAPLDGIVRHGLNRSHSEGRAKGR